MCIRDREWIVGQGYGDDIATVRSSSTIQGAAYHPSIQPDFWFDKMSEKVDPDEVYLNGERAKVAAKGAVPLPMMGNLRSLRRISEGSGIWPLRYSGLGSITTVCPVSYTHLDVYKRQACTS